MTPELELELTTYRAALESVLSAMIVHRDELSSTVRQMEEQIADVQARLDEIGEITPDDAVEVT